MADWSGSTRSNYFKVKDLDAFKNMMSNFQAEIITRENTDLVGFYSTRFNGDIPTYFPDEGKEEVSIVEIIADHLDDNQVCIVQSIGSEKLRYVTGIAYAIHSSGEILQIDINDIYAKAQSEFGGDASITEATL